MEICPNCEVYISGQGLPEECPVCLKKLTNTLYQSNPGWNSDKRLEQMKQEILHGHFTLTEVIDAIIEINGLIGVGLITLGDQLKEYCYSKAGEKQSVS